MNARTLTIAITLALAIPASSASPEAPAAEPPLPCHADPSAPAREALDAALALQCAAVEVVTEAYRALCAVDACPTWWLTYWLDRASEYAHDSCRAALGDSCPVAPP